MASAFDEMQHTFTCSNAQCGERFQETIGRLVQLNEVVCPKCGTTEDIRESKRHGPIGLEINTTSNIEKERRKKK